MVLCPVPDHPATACMIWRQTRPGQGTCLGHVTHASGVQGTIMTCGYRITTRVKYRWRAGGHMPWWCLIRKTVTIAAWMYLFMDNKNMIKNSIPNNEPLISLAFLFYPGTYLCHPWSSLVYRGTLSRYAWPSPYILVTCTIDMQNTNHSN